MVGRGVYTELLARVSSEPLPSWMAHVRCVSEKKRHPGVQSAAVASWVHQEQSRDKYVHVPCGLGEGRQLGQHFRPLTTSY